MRVFLFITLLAFYSGALEASAANVWGALVLGTQEESAIPARLRPHEDMLKKVFGYKSYKILGQSTRKLSQSEETWIIPSNELFLRVVGKERDGKLRMNVQLYHGRKLLVETNANMAKGKPFVIRGPQWGEGQLILMLVAK